LTDLDYSKLTKGVEKRLDDIFADDLQNQSPPLAKLKFIKPPSLVSLRNIIMSLEWEVTDDHLKDLKQELRRLQRAYIKDYQLQKLFQILLHLALYIKVYKGDTHPYVFKSLFRAYNGLAKIVSGKYSNHQKAKIVDDQIKRYLSLKDYLKRKKKKDYQHTVNKLNTLEKSFLSPIDYVRKEKPFISKDESEIDYRTINNNFIELGKFISLELRNLRAELQSMLTLINKKSIS
jgi:hypothetical protein